MRTPYTAMPYNAAKRRMPRTLQRQSFFTSACTAWIIIRIWHRMPRLLNMGYDYLILDLGSLNESAAAEFLRCDRKIVLGSLALWKAWSYEEFFKQFDSFTNLGEGYHYLVQMGTFQNHSVFSRQHSISMQEVPFIKNPFHIEKEHFLFFDILLSFYSL